MFVIVNLCFCLCSGIRLTHPRICTYFQRTDSLRWTPYLQDCVNLLINDKECSNDLYLAYLVRLQLLNEKIREWHEGLGEAKNLLYTPARFYMQTLVVQLDNIRQNIPTDLQQNSKLSW